MARRLVLAVALVAALLPVAGAGGAHAQTPKRGGTVVVGTYLEPACLNAYLEKCGSSLPFVGIVMGLSLRGAFSVGADSATYRPDLVSRVDVSRRPPFTLTYHIRREARWSDGTPITARDFVFTHNAIRSVMAEVWEPDAETYAAVKSVEAVDPKTARVVLRSRSARSRWRGLFPRVLPAHALRGEDISRVWADRIDDPKTGRPIGSGPFLVQRWERGHAVTFVRNPGYWKHPPHLDRIVVRFARGALGADDVEWMRSGELDVLSTNLLTSEAILELRNVRGVTTRVIAGPSWEHLDIRIGPGGHAALKRKAVRRALAYGIDRVAIARMLYGQVAPGYPPSDSAVYPVASPYYEPNWQQYRYRPAEARRLLEGVGCRRGVDGIYACAGERLSFRIVTTSGIARRRQAVEAIQRQLRQAGIDVVPAYAPGPALFGQIFASGDFDLVLFTYLRFPDSPGTTGGVYGCGGVQNIAGYCQRLVTRDLDQARRILDLDRQARVLNRADAQLARDVPVLPLYQVPTTIANSTRVRGFDIASFFDPFVGAEDWWLDD